MWCAIRSSAVSWKPMRGRMLEVATSVGPGWPDDPDWEVLAIGAAHAAVSHTPFGGLIEAPFDAEISIRLTDDAEVRKLNHAYRQKDKPKNGRASGWERVCQYVYISAVAASLTIIYIGLPVCSPKLDTVCRDDDTDSK